MASDIHPSEAATFTDRRAIRNVLLHFYFEVIQYHKIMVCDFAECVDSVTIQILTK